MNFKTPQASKNVCTPVRRTITFLTDQHALDMVSLHLTLLVLAILPPYAFSLPSPRVLPDFSPSETPLSAANGWSKEAILALTGVCVAVLGILGGLAWRRMWRSWSGCRTSSLCTTFCIQCFNADPLVADPADIHLVRSRLQRARRIRNWRLRNQDEVRRQLQEQYNELLEMRRQTF